jgi:hypothetical protein
MMIDRFVLFTSQTPTTSKEARKVIHRSPEQRKAIIFLSLGLEHAIFEPTPNSTRQMSLVARTKSG